MGQDTVKIGQDQIVKKGHFLPFRFLVVLTHQTETVAKIEVHR